MKDFIVDRYNRFNEHNNLDPNDPDTFEVFLKYLETTQGDSRPPLGEDEAFSIYSQYCFMKKHLKTPPEIHKLADRKYQHEYNKKKFKSLASRKSRSFMADKTFLFKVKNMHTLIFASSTDFESIDVGFISIEEFMTKLGKCYKLTAKNFSDPLLFTGHFMDRYAERNGLPIHREDNIMTFLEHMVAKSTLTIGKTNTGHCSLPLQTGLALGHKIKEIFIFKTFVDGDILRNDQIIEAILLKSKEREYKDKYKNLY